MKCLFVFHDCALSFNHSGASTRRMMDFQALIQNGAEVHVLRFVNRLHKSKLLEFESKAKIEINQYRSQCNSWTDVDYLPTRFSKKGIIQALISPVKFFYPEIEQQVREFDRLLTDLDPQIVWTVSPFSAVVAYQSKLPFKWVNYIGDWRHKLRLIRVNYIHRSLSAKAWQRFVSFSQKRMDIKILKKCDVVETASMQQQKELQVIGIKHVRAIPQFYPKPSSIPTTNQGATQIIHLGNLITTSNQVGLFDYLNHVHPHLNGEQAVKENLIVIGGKHTKSRQLSRLLEQHNIKCLGHVIDLSSVIQPYDIGIIPYQMDTGMRTKIALFHSFKMAVLSFRAPVQGMR